MNIYVDQAHVGGGTLRFLTDLTQFCLQKSTRLRFALDEGLIARIQLLKVLGQVHIQLTVVLRIVRLQV